MERIIVDGKEMECSVEGLPVLSDEELEMANGGAGETSYHTRWVCVECGARGTWDCKNSIRSYEMNFHYQQTGHYNFKTEGRYFDGPVDPYVE